MNKKVLIIDDDQKLNNLLITFLSSYGFETEAVTHPDEGLKIVFNRPPELVILDIMLPDKDGFEVCREIRSQSDIPIIMLTARGEVTDRIVGLELGADDYLPKPFEPRELVARMQTVLRRKTSVKNYNNDILTYSDLVIDKNKRIAFIGEKDIELTTMEFDLLLLFTTNSGIALDRDKIMDSLRGYEWDAFDRAIDVAVSRLRNKLNDDPQKPQFIKTVWGKGYMFIGEN